jgi:uridine kinase
MRPVVIGVAGGTGSGKTTVLTKIMDSLGDNAISFIQHGFCYKDHPELTLEDRGALHDEHPDTLETSLLAAHLEELRNGRVAAAPRYDSSLHARRTETQRIEPRKRYADIIILEGDSNTVGVDMLLTETRSITSSTE